MDKKKKFPCWNERKHILTLLGVITGAVFMIVICAILSVL